MSALISKEQVIYKFSPNASPVARINSNEIVEFETRDAFSGQVTSKDESVSNLDFSHVNAATGPIFIKEASPGKTLKVEILEIDIDEVGYQCIAPGFGLLKDKFKEAMTLECRVKGNMVHAGNHTFKISPNIGTIGVAPKDEEIETLKPGDHGGNLDTKEICAGSTLYLPIFVEGGLFALGDVHAIQGDGEVCGVSIEIGAKIKVKLTVVNFKINRPLVLTEDNIITLASAETIDEAVYLATEDMIDLLSNDNFKPAEVYTYLTLTGDLRVSQTVNPLKTAKMVTPRKQEINLDDII